VRWTVIVPMRSLPSAKSRLVELTPDPTAHRDLVEAIRHDTLAAIDAASVVTRVVLVVDRPIRTDYDVLVQRAPGLNPALAEAQSWAQSQWPGGSVAALVGDLPALRASDLEAALVAAEALERAFVADASGLGTTMLTARPGVALRPAFGLNSAARHALIATALDAGPGLRLDVDTPEDLDAAGELGLGPRTSELLVNIGR
jgi:2-phospho-L-lactate guanylyltransferase